MASDSEGLRQSHFLFCLCVFESQMASDSEGLRRAVVAPADGPGEPPGSQMASDSEGLRQED